MFRYDDENRPTSITYPSGGGSVTDLYEYNAIDQRVRAQLDGTWWRYIYNANRVLEETNDSGTVLARHTTESGSYYVPWVHMWRTGGVSRFPLMDGVGTTRRLVDSSNNHTDIYELTAFGHDRGSTITTTNPYQFGGAWGYITDATLRSSGTSLRSTSPSGMLQLGHRFYWPEIGRFIQQDPIGSGINSYAYVGNNPVVFIDPSGYDYTDIAGHVGPVLFGVQLTNPDPCAPSPPWWDVFGISQKVHPYVGLGPGLSASVMYAPGDQYPKKGFYAAGQAGCYAGGSAVLGLQGQGPGYEVGATWGVSVAGYYVLW